MMLLRGWDLDKQVRTYNIIEAAKIIAVNEKSGEDEPVDISEFMDFEEGADEMFEAMEEIIEKKDEEGKEIEVHKKKENPKDSQIVQYYKCSQCGNQWKQPPKNERCPRCGIVLVYGRTVDKESIFLPEGLGEAQAPRGVLKPKGPTEAERERHSLTHLPFRSWCAHCVRGRGKTMVHKQVPQERKLEEKPVIQIDYHFLRDDDPEDELETIVTAYDTAQGRNRDPDQSEGSRCIHLRAHHQMVGMGRTFRTHHSADRQGERSSGTMQGNRSKETRRDHD